MPHSTSLLRPRWLVLATLLLSLALSSPTAADFRRSYLDGVQAARKGDWDRVIRHMREAIAGDPAEKSRVRLVGAIPEAYLPHFYLGRAYYEKRDCAQVLVSWRTSQQQQAIESQVDLAAEVEQGLTHCQNLNEAAAALTQSKAQRERLRSLRDNNPGTWGESLVARERKSDEHISLAEASLAESRAAWKPDLASEARRLSVELSMELESLLEELKQQLDSLHRRTLRSELTAPATHGRQLLNQAMTQPPTMALQTSVSELGDLLEKMDGAKTTTGELRDLTRQLPKAVENLQALLNATRQEVAPTELSLQPASPGPPPPAPPPPAPENPPEQPIPTASEARATIPPDWLALAAQAYFEGRYNTALELLERKESPPELRFYIHLFRGAARYSIFLLGEKEEPALRELASEDFRQCRRHDPSFHPTSEYFSPRLIQFYENHTP